MPYPYELKNTNEKLTYVWGIGNKIKKFKDDNDGLILISDEEIEKKKGKHQEERRKSIK